MSSILQKTRYVVYRRIGAARPRRDTPFIEAHTQGFYKEVSGALSALLHTALKTSDDLQFAMLTGIQRVAKENTPKAGRGLFRNCSDDSRNRTDVLYSCHRNEGEYGSAGIYQKGRGADR